jgi:aldehyde:ferredoxin oxidoreductase
MYGFYNVLLDVDVTRRSFVVRQLDDDLLRRTLGGKGLATQLLLENNPPGVDPLSPENVVIFANGPLSGSRIWGSCRYGVYSKSPQTGFYSESYAGGTLSERIAAAGIDVLLIRGAADEPVWLEIVDATVHFHSAADLWGLHTYDTEDRVNQWIKSNRPAVTACGTICIGPAGENLVAYAVLENDYWRSAGRTGVGAVLGSKRIKAVAFHGGSRKQFADDALMLSFSRSIAAVSKDNPGVMAYKAKGTPMLVDMISKVGAFPTRYWQKGRFEGAAGINADALHSRCDVKPKTCLKCFMACGRLSTVKSGRHQGLQLEGPEYETIYTFGGLCEIDAIEEILYLNDICDRLGLDTISAGNLAAFTIEAARQGRIDLDIDYGNVDAIAALLADIAYRRGIGDLLARGIIPTARAWGMEDQAIHVKGLEPAGYDPRVFKGMGLAYASADRGACHLRSSFFKPELTGLIGPDQIEGKALMFTEWEDRLIIMDSLVLCRFFRDLYQWEQLTIIFKASMGLDLDKAAMRAIASGISDNTRRFNIREGLTPADDQLPARFHDEPLPEDGKVITRPQMATLLADYYQARGWNSNGEPGAASWPVSEA